MKFAHTTFLAAALIAVALLIGSALRPASSPANLQTERSWQHLALTHRLSKGLDNPELREQIVSLGQQGWELVDVETTLDAGKTDRVIYFFKKPR